MPSWRVGDMIRSQDEAVTRTSPWVALLVLTIGLGLVIAGVALHVYTLSAVGLVAIIIAPYAHRRRPNG